MARFKVGDEVKLVKIGGSVDETMGVKLGDIGEIRDVLEDIENYQVKFPGAPIDLYVSGHEMDFA